MSPAIAQSPLRYSYVHGASDVPLVGETIGVHFERSVDRWGDREAIVMRHQNIRLTFRQLKDRVDSLAAGLLALGLEPGDRIGIWATNCIEWVITQFATARAGLIQVNLDPAYRTAEIDYALNKVGCKALITMDRFKSSDYLGMLRTLMPEIDTSTPGALRSAKVPSLSLLIHIGQAQEPGFLRFDDVAAMASDAARERLAQLQHQLQFDDPINIQFTSGTTGTPKATTLSHHSLLNNALSLGSILGVREGDRLCRTGPLFHIMGTTASLYAVGLGATLVFASETFNPRAVLEAVSQERCTHLSGVPTMFVMMLNLPDFHTFDLSSVRGGIMGGSLCPIELMERVMTDMHARDLIITYGMTETGPTSMCTRASDPIERRVSTVGQVFPHVEVKIVDADGKVVPVGSVGELCTRGYSVMRGYWNDPEVTRKAIDANGWMHTGDLAVMDEEGYARIVGRIKEMVIRGGENLFPAEIEGFLTKHPDIAEAQVFGVPDEKFGEELCAWILPKEGRVVTEESVRAFSEGRIAHYKVPRYLRFVDRFPVNATGKAQKKLMREQMLVELAKDA
ncbi:MAG: AMP-binding protein [Ramlibacter sp.]